MTLGILRVLMLGHLCYSHVPTVAASLANALDDTGVLWFQADAGREL